MSQDAFAATLAAMMAVAVVAVWLYCFISSADQPGVRHVLSLGITMLPLDALRLRRGHRGRHAAVMEPMVGTIAEWLRSGREPSAEPAPAMPAAPGPLLEPVEGPTVPELEVRSAEILAHEEDERRVPPPPERTLDGATEEWSPVAEIGTDRPAVVLQHAEPDAEELRILASLEALVEEWRVLPDWMVEWGETTDAYLEAAKLNVASHRRWRYGVLDFPTSELPRVLASTG